VLQVVTELLQQTSRLLSAMLAHLDACEAEADRQRVEIAKLTQELEDTNAGIIALYQELDDKSIELEKKNAELKEATRLKSEFLANMSHEIRTPMNAIIGVSGILSRSALSAEQIRLVELLREAGRSLLALINDILDFSKIEAGKLVLEEVDFSLTGIVEGTVELLRTNADEKKLPLFTFVAPEIPALVRGDPSRLRQIIMNLTNNAIKFTRKGRIAVRAELTDAGPERVTVRFSVSDTGIGIPDGERKYLFKPFTQIDGSTSRKYGGTGLGLSICKHLVELMGGEIGVESEVGKGSTFWFTMPFKRVSAEPPAPLIKEYLRSKRILIVDDDPGARDMLGLYLSSWQIPNEAAASGEQALEMIKQQADTGAAYDIALIDSVMPGLSGVELAAELKKDPRLAGMRIILITAYDYELEAEDAISKGFDGYLIKPIRQSSLYDCLTGVIERMARGAEVAPATPAARGRPAVAPLQLDVRGDGLILLAEDNAINQMVTLAELQELGLTAHVVGDGNEALKALSRHNYALVLMDCQMPELDGFAATREVRRRETGTGRHVPIIAMTASTMQGDRERCLAAGMDDYIGKPVELNELREALQRWLPARPLAEGKGEAGDKEKTIDLAYLESRFTSEQVLAILRTYITSAEADIQALKTAVQSQDPDAVAFHAHSLKGSSATLTADKIADLSRSLEEAASSLDWRSAASILEQIEQSFALLESYIRDKLPEL